MKSIFKTDKMFDVFIEQGYVIIPFLSLEQIADLKELYRKVQPISFPDFSSTIYNKDIDLKKSTSNGILKILSENIDSKFENFKSLGAGFLCKTPGAESEMPIHQDWSIVDETNSFSATVWAPLQDVDVNNGALMVIPGSHRISTEARGPSLPPLIDSIKNDLLNHLKIIPLKAGEAIVFNHALIHASPPNLSSEDRLAVTLGFVHSETKLIFNHFSNGKLKTFNIPDNFFLTYNNIGDEPEHGICTEEKEYTPIQLNRNQLLDFYRKIEINNSKKMKKLFADPVNQSFFEKNGFVKINMLDQKAVNELVDFFHQQGLRDHSGYGFNMSMEDEDKEKVKKIREKIFEIALPQALPHFSNAKVIAGSYVVKEKNPQGVVPPHQDWSFVENEKEFNSVTCWISLVHTKMENGFMGVIKGSHLFYDNHRPSPSPQVPTPLMNHLFAIFPYLEMFEMSPGEALIFDHRTFHASTPNVTDEPRIAIGLGFTQQDAKLCHYSLKQNDKKDTLLKYAIDDSFLSKYDNATISKMYDNNIEIGGYQIIDELAYDCPNEPTDLLVERIVAAGNSYNETLADYMGNLFGYQQKNKSEENDTDNSASLPFWKVYTPINILREVRYRLIGK